MITIDEKAKELRDNAIQAVLEVGWPASIIERENAPTSELIKTVDLIEEIFYGYAMFLYNSKHDTKNN